MISQVNAPCQPPILFAIKLFSDISYVGFVTTTALSVLYTFLSKF